MNLLCIVQGNDGDDDVQAAGYCSCEPPPIIDDPFTYKELHCPVLGIISNFTLKLMNDGWAFAAAPNERVVSVRTSIKCLLPQYNYVGCRRRRRRNESLKLWRCDLNGNENLKPI